MDALVEHCEVGPRPVPMNTETQMLTKLRIKRHHKLLLCLDVEQLSRADVLGLVPNHIVTAGHHHDVAC